MHPAVRPGDATEFRYLSYRRRNKATFIARARGSQMLPLSYFGGQKRAQLAQFLLGNITTVDGRHALFATEQIFSDVNNATVLCFRAINKPTSLNI